MLVARLTQCVFVFCLILYGQGCADAPTIVRSAASDAPATVTLEQTQNGYQMLVNGEPFYIQGAGLEYGDIEKLAAHGANSFRTWRTDNGQSTGQEVLDRAHENGLMVTMGIEVGRERVGTGMGIFGFDYNDPAAIAEQRERVREEVMMYKDHPALLIWSIGNELNLGSTNPMVWNEVNELSKMIHDIDPNHLTTTTLAGINPELAAHIKERAPDLDILSIQMYADIVNLPRYMEEIGWDGPYMVTEWGATGHWEVATTPWGAPIENNSSVKADYYKTRYETAIAPEKGKSIGSYVFLWGQKQERTPTWYGMFGPGEEETEAIDVMHYIWNGSWPANRSPRLEEMVLDNRSASDAITLAAGTTYAANVTSTDPDGDALRFHWEIRHESEAVSEGGDEEEVPELLEGLVVPADESTINMIAPQRPGAYRLFVYVYDDQGHIAHANVPFLVSE